MSVMTTPPTAWSPPRVLGTHILVVPDKDEETRAGILLPGDARRFTGVVVGVGAMVARELELRPGLRVGWMRDLAAEFDYDGVQLVRINTARHHRCECGRLSTDTAPDLLFADEQPGPEWRAQMAVRLGL